MTSFSNQLDGHSVWRREAADQLTQLGDWLREHDLLDVAMQARLDTAQSQLSTDKLRVAFVAEFSRGKSELINAVFFAQYGRRLLPARAGRTTMCPSELGYDASQPTSLRLLPIESRSQPQTLAEWRQTPEHWTQLPLDTNSPEQMAVALEKITEVRRVTIAEARALDFWHDETPDDNPLPDQHGMVEVPRWRHALINLPHPLLAQGLVILDTPGLNAIGAEPELTINLIPQAHAVVFILGADTGVTRSDMAIWREHLVVDDDRYDTRMVVLNKIDTLWDPMNPAADVEAQIQRQRSHSAAVLGLPESRVLALSAQKGLLGKVNGDGRLLQASRLAHFEQLLGQTVLSQRQQTLAGLLDGTVTELAREAARLLQVRRRDLAEQLIEFNGLRGKNTAVIQHMRLRVDGEEAEFNASLPRINAIRAVHLKLKREVVNTLAGTRLAAATAPLQEALAQPGIKLGLKKTYAEALGNVRACIDATQQLVREMDTMLTTAFRQLNADHGFSLELPTRPDLSRFVDTLDKLERHHLRYLGVTQVFRLSQPDFTARLMQTLMAGLQAVFAAALKEAALWSKAATAQLDTQMLERRRSFAQRADGISRIQQAAGSLEERLAELTEQENALRQTEAQLDQLTSRLRAAMPAHPELRQVA